MIRGEPMLGGFRFEVPWRRECRAVFQSPWRYSLDGAHWFETPYLGNGVTFPGVVVGLPTGTTYVYSESRNGVSFLPYGGELVPPVAGVKPLLGGVSGNWHIAAKGRTFDINLGNGALMPGDAVCVSIRSVVKAAQPGSMFKPEMDGLFLYEFSDPGMAWSRGNSIYVPKDRVVTAFRMKVGDGLRGVLELWDTVEHRRLAQVQVSGVTGSWVTLPLDSPVELKEGGGYNLTYVGGGGFMALRYPDDDDGSGVGVACAAPMWGRPTSYGDNSFLNTVEASREPVAFGWDVVLAPEGPGEIGPTPVGLWHLRANDGTDIELVPGDNYVWLPELTAATWFETDSFTPATIEIRKVVGA